MTARKPNPEDVRNSPELLLNVAEAYMHYRASVADPASIPKQEYEIWEMLNTAVGHATLAVEGDEHLYDYLPGLVEEAKRLNDSVHRR